MGHLLLGLNFFYSLCRKNESQRLAIEVVYGFSVGIFHSMCCKNESQRLAIEVVFGFSMGILKISGKYVAFS